MLSPASLARRGLRSVESFARCRHTSDKRQQRSSRLRGCKPRQALFSVRLRPDGIGVLRPRTRSCHPLSASELPVTREALELPANRLQSRSNPMTRSCSRLRAHTAWASTSQTSVGLCTTACPVQSRLTISRSAGRHVIEIPVGAFCSSRSSAGLETMNSCKRTTLTSSK